MAHDQAPNKPDFMQREGRGKPRPRHCHASGCLVTRRGYLRAKGLGVAQGIRRADGYAFFQIAPVAARLAKHRCVNAFLYIPLVRRAYATRSIAVKPTPVIALPLRAVVALARLVVPSCKSVAVHIAAKRVRRCVQYPFANFGSN